MLEPWSLMLREAVGVQIMPSRTRTIVSGLIAAWLTYSAPARGQDTRWLSPLIRASSLHAMSYDAARGATVLFGGGASGVYLDDTWMWNGSAWMLQTAPGPPGRSWHAMVYDTARDATLLFGGY